MGGGGRGGKSNGRNQAYVNMKRGGTNVIVNVKKCAKTVHTKRVNSTLVQYSAANMAHHYNHRTNAFSYFELVIAPLVMVLLTLFHQ
jgi:hypothetical protein